MIDGDDEIKNMLFMFQWGGLSCPILIQRATCILIYLYMYLYSSMWGPSFSSYPATMSPWNKEALKSMRKELGGVKMEVGMINDLEKSDVPNPANMGFLSPEQLQVVKSKATPAEKMNEVIDYLLKMEDKHFKDFCKILEQNNFGLQARMLKKKAEELERSVGKLEHKQHTCMCSNTANTCCM